MKKKKRQRSRWPSGVPVFRDGKPSDCDLLVGVGMSPGRIDVLYMPRWIDVFDGMWTNFAPSHYQGGGDITGLQLLTPINADARAMLAIAKAAR